MNLKKVSGGVKKNYFNSFNDSFQDKDGNQYEVTSSTSSESNSSSSNISNNSTTVTRGGNLSKLMVNLGE